MTAETDAETPLGTVAYAKHYGCTHGHISALKKRGVIHGPALTRDGRILPSIADAQIASWKATGKGAGTANADLPESSSNTYARERTALVSAQRQRQEMDNQVRRGELIERRAVAAVIPPAARRFRDAILQQVRDRIASDTERAALLADIAAATESFIAEAIPDGGADPS
jgi:phage terminase Nu1 subunit (DNA packaging protein)